MNLLEGLHEQMDRARELKKLYEGIPGGGFGASVIDEMIRRTEQSIESGDVVDMLAMYKALEELR